MMSGQLIDNEARIRRITRDVALEIVNEIAYKESVNDSYASSTLKDSTIDNKTEFSLEQS